MVTLLHYKGNSIKKLDSDQKEAWNDQNLIKI